MMNQKIFATVHATTI